MAFSVCQTSIDRFTAAFMLDTFKVQAFTITSDSSGGQTQTWADETTGVAGFIEGSKILRNAETMIGGSEQEQRKWSITLEQGTTVDASRRVIQTHKDGVAITNRTFKVLSVIDGETFDVGVSIEAVELPNLV
jgi:head-tail adaptor